MLTCPCTAHAYPRSSPLSVRLSICRMSSASFIDLVQAVAFLFLSLSVADQRSCVHWHDGLTFVFIYAPLCLKCDRTENPCIPELGFQRTKGTVSSCHSQMNLHVSPSFLAKCVCVVFLREKMPFHHVTAGLLYKGNYLNRSLSDSDSDVLASISVEELAGEVSPSFIISEALKHEPVASPSQSQQSPALPIPQVACLPGSIC